MSEVAEGPEMSVDWLMSLCHRVIQTPDCFKNKTCYLLFAYDTKRDKMGDRTSLLLKWTNAHCKSNDCSCHDWLQNMLSSKYDDDAP